MSITPIQAAGASPSSQALQQMAQAANQTSQPPAGAAEMPASVEMPSTSVQAGSETGFTDSVLDSVYTEIDKLGSKMPAASTTESAVGSFKDQMASKADSISPLEASSIQDPKHEAVSALSKTFDHAIFMAMVNQVVSGVSDTSRTLIRQS